MEWKDSILNVHDFGRSLLGEMMIAPHLKRDSSTPIIFIGHSMGDLVIKKAYLLARQEARDIAQRVKYIFFLATPHRGSDSASLLNNLLSVSGVLSRRQYVADLGRNSVALQVINDEFKNFANDVELWSFYETVKTSSGIKSTIIVARDSAVLGYEVTTAQCRSSKCLQIRKPGRAKLRDSQERSCCCCRRYLADCVVVAEQRK